MKRIIHLGTFLLIGLFAHMAMGQDTFTWKAVPADNNWANAANWTKSGTAFTDTYPGQTAGRQLDVAVISNGGTPIINTGATFAIRRLDIWNTTGPVTGSTLTISQNAILNVGLAENNVRLRGGNIINNGTLNISSTATGYAGFPVYGINFDNPVVLPSSPTEYGISGSGTMTINIGSANFAGAAAIAAIGNSGTTTTPTNNANVTYKIVANITSLTLNNSSAATIAAVRSLGGNNANKLIISGTGFTVGSVGSPDSKAQLIGLSAGCNITIDTNTTLTFNAAAGVTSSIIGLYSASALPTNFTNKGAINLLGSCARSAMGFSSGSSSTATVFNISNEGTLNIDMNLVTVGTAALSITNGGGGTANAGTAVNFSNTGTMTLKNTAATAGTGFSIYMVNAGETAPLIFTNSGTLNLEGTVYNYGPKCTIHNTGIINSNSELRSFAAINNNVEGSINFAKNAATATSRQVVFNGLQALDVSGSVGNVYFDGTNYYTVIIQKFGSGTTMVANVLSTATVPKSGTLTLFSSGTTAGTTPLTFTSVSLPSIENALTSSTTNSGTINTDTASNLNIISGVTNASTGVIAPGGASGKGIADFSKSGTTTIASTLRLQVSGNSTAGVDFDQITNSATDGGFDISGAILDISSLYTPVCNISIPIVTASGGGTISGTFASETGLTAGWSLDYSPTAVNLIYNTGSSPTATIWTGAANSDFFNEANWKYSVSNTVPAAGTINPGTPINLALEINVPATITASGSIVFCTGSLAVGTTVGAVNLSATSISGGTVTINEGGYIQLSDAAPLPNNVRINFTSGIGWIRTPSYTARNVSTNNIAQMKVNGSPAVYETNLRLDHYYLNGCVIRANLAATAPLTVYDSANRVGTPVGITVNTIHSGVAIAGTMNNKIESFILKKGFMVTFAVEDDGTGKSKNYIASEADLEINSLPIALINSISFVRVMPWNWATKKGRTDIETDLNTSWVYKWNNTLNTTLDWEYAPMSWGWNAAKDTDIPTYTGKYNSTHVMSFNEPDNCNDQSGVYTTGYNNLKLCDTDAAVFYHKNLMKTGMRIVSPGGREEAPFAWLKEFYDKAKVQDIRIDVIAVHWYDWGSNPVANPNHTGLQVFNRFKAYLTNVHNLYGLPIWITEFNANPARSQTINSDFMALALPYLESLDYIERYNWFPYNTGTDFYTDVANTLISDVGMTYRDQVSTPAISDANVVVYNNLPNVALSKTATASSTFAGSSPADAVDGDTITTTSQWVKNFGVSGDSNYSVLPAWLEVDLLGSYTINGLQIIEQTNALKDFTFQVWNATTNSWNTVLTVVGNPATPLATFKTFTPITTTRVRLNITAHNSTDYIKMFEIEVYGEPNNPTWTGITSSTWSVATNWSTGIVPDKYSNVTITNVGFPPTISTTTTINSLNIAAGATLSVTAPNFTIAAALANSGTMTLANNSNLIQGGSVNANTGNIIVNRNSNALKRLDYTMWSSPVANQNLLAFSPKTTSTRFYKYNESSDVYNSVDPLLTSFADGRGYLIRMPNTDTTFGYDAGTDTLIYQGVFTGIPNNGNVKLSSLTSDRFYSVGNPYPSTISAASFLSLPSNSTGGTLYFWRKTNGVANSGSAYATWTTVGGVAAGAVAPNNIVPNGTIQVGQGFIVKTGASATSLTFTNAMRLGDTSTQFLKTKQVAEPDRIWLNLTNTTGIFSQALVGYMDGATLGVDNGIDGEYINDAATALTSDIAGGEYTIQGRPTFDPSDVVALNFKTDLDGEYTIALDHFDGVFANGQDVYLVDSKTGAETDLKAAAYTFTAAEGVDNTRFSLKYQKTLRVDAPSFNENSVRVYKNNGTLNANAGDINISKIKVFDIQGRLIMEQKNLKSTTVMIKNIAATNQVLIIEITSEDNTVVAKKVIN